MNTIIDVDGIKFTYGESTVLKDVSFSVERGTFVSIIGPNGSGKTTLLKNMSGVLHPSEGKISIKDKPLSAYRKRELARLMAFVPQSTSIDFGFTVMDIVLMGRAPYLGPFDSESIEDMAIAESAMEKVHIAELRDKKINEISGGEAQRALIACALTQSTEVLLLDEPVSNLDIQHQVEVLDIIKGMCIEKSMTVVAVLHDLNLASEYSDNIILMKDGILENSGKPEDVITEENIKRVYNTNIYMMANPLSGRPYVIPVTRN